MTFSASTALRNLPAHDRHAVLHVEYDGTPFAGWARQPGGRPTVEGALLDAFARLRCSDVMIRCSGRTDAGVHAARQVVDVRYRGSIETPLLARALSGIVPDELVVVDSADAPAGFDARGDATSRAYEYRVLPSEAASPLRHRYVLHHPRALDREALVAAGEMARGQHRFTAFTPSKTAHRYFDRTLVTSRWIERGDELVYQIRGNAFLRHMVRVLVGSMLAVGRGEVTLEDFAAMLDGAPRSEARATALPHGLCLVDVTYDVVDGLATPPGWTGPRRPDLASLDAQVCTPGWVTHPF